MSTAKNIPSGESERFFVKPELSKLIFTLKTANLLKYGTPAVTHN